MRLITTILNAQGKPRYVKIYRNAEASEYICRLYIEGRHYGPADYYTDDGTDATKTAYAMVETPMVLKKPKALQRGKPHPLGVMLSRLFRP